MNGVTVHERPFRPLVLEDRVIERVDRRLDAAGLGVGWSWRGRRHEFAVDECVEGGVLDRIQSSVDGAIHCGVERWRRYNLSIYDRSVSEGRVA